MEKRPRIVFRELPPRPREVTEAEYSAVIGGCVGEGGPCTKSGGECCKDLVCINGWPFTSDGRCGDPDWV